MRELIIKNVDALIHWCYQHPNKKAKAYGKYVEFINLHVGLCPVYSYLFNTDEFQIMPDTEDVYITREEMYDYLEGLYNHKTFHPTEIEAWLMMNS